MKLRTTQNSIRLRLRRSEVATLGKEHVISEKVAFPNGSTLSYAVQQDPKAGEIDVSFEDHRILIRLPSTMAMNWVQTNEVGIQASLPLEDGEQLSILIEKDFPCNGREDEDKADTFWELATSDEPESC